MVNGGEGRVSGKSREWVETLDVTEVVVGCPGKVENEDEKMVINGCCEQVLSKMLYAGYAHKKTNVLTIYYFAVPLQLMYENGSVNGVKSL
uniref:Uncharacterized protein n=1 Tax=Lactuca sativa TaxID=4236 RepID=A0A9R1VDQ4_LACSA|nr:hypothetical protein LSAT_V11C500259770 [Lactuca sativa]